MALTKVSRGLLSTGIVDNSNATAITLNADESATFANRVGIGVAAHSSDALNITSTNQHIRFNNGSELGILALTSDGDLDFWAHGADEKINFRTGTGSGTVAMNVVGTKVGIGTNSIHDFGTNNNEFQINGVKGGSVAFSRGTNGATEQFALRTSDDDALRFEYGSNYASEAMRIDQFGNTIFGTTNFAPVSNNVQGISIRNFGELQSSRDGGATLYLNRKTNDGSIVIFRQDGADVGTIAAHSGDLHIGTGTCGIRFLDGDPSLSPYNPTSGANADNTIQLGRSNVRFDDAFITNGVTTGSDRDLKQDIEELTDAEKRVAVAAKALLRKYRWKDAVAEKGDDARIHVGIIAQDLQACFAAESLDAARYGMWCSDTWTNDDGSEQTRLSIRYSELLAFIISAI